MMDNSFSTLLEENAIVLQQKMIYFVRMLTITQYIKGTSEGE